jgi:hypothetical protein
MTAMNIHIDRLTVVMPQQSVMASEFSTAALDKLLQNVISDDGCAIAAPQQIPEIGERWPEQGGVRAAYMPPQDGHPGYSLILVDMPADAPEKLAWGRQGHEYKESSAWDGLTNTRALVASGDHPAAKFCHDLRIDVGGGRVLDDCYLPARREASLIAGAVPHLIKPGYHWTSTQYGADNASVQGFASGFQFIISKASAYRVVAVRRFIH